MHWVGKLLRRRPLKFCNSMVSSVLEKKHLLTFPPKTMLPPDSLLMNRPILMSGDSSVRETGQVWTSEAVRTCGTSCQGEWGCSCCGCVCELLPIIRWSHAIWWGDPLLLDAAERGWKPESFSASAHAAPVEPLPSVHRWRTILRGAGRHEHPPLDKDRFG